MDANEQRLKSQLMQEEHSVEEDDTIWLLSYADLMTLLFTFFAMLYSSAMMDEGATLRKTLASYLQGNGDQNQVSYGNGNGAGSGGGQTMKGVGPGAGAGAGPGSGPSAGAGSGPGGGGPGSGNVTLGDLRKQLSSRLEDEQALRDTKIEIKNQGLEVTFSSNLLFDSGSAELRPESLEPLKKVIAVLKDKAAKMKIRIEGHTDDVPIHRARFKSNWELSGARAANIVELFERQGFEPDRLLAVGYGSSRPLLPNRAPSGERDPEAQRRNRRVVLTVFSPALAKPTDAEQK